MTFSRLGKTLFVVIFLTVLTVDSLLAQSRRSGGSRRKKNVWVTWCVSFDQGWVEAEERGCPVVIFFIQDGEPQNEALVTETLRSRQFVQISDKCVSMIASLGTAKEHREIKEKRDGVDVMVCKKYRTVTCLEHKQVEREAFLAFFDGNVDTPHTLVCRPDRSIFGRFDDHVPLSDVMRLVNRAADELGATLSRSAYLEIRGGLAEAADLAKQRKYTDAWNKLEVLISQKPRGIQAAKVDLLLSSIQDAGEEFIKDAEVKVKLEKYGKAVEILENTIDLFKGTSVHKKARKRLNKLKRDPGVAAALDKYVREREAGEVLKEANKNIGRRQFVKATANFVRLLEYFSDTEAGKLAVEEFADLVSDARSAATVKRYLEGEGRKRLKRAEGYLRGGQTDKAKKAFRVILEVFGTTGAAVEAKNRLEELGA